MNNTEIRNAIVFNDTNGVRRKRARPVKAAASTSIVTLKDKRHASAVAQLNQKIVKEKKS